jgi:hypothetical protein
VARLIRLIAKALGLKPYDHYEIVVRPDGRWQVYFKKWDGFGHLSRHVSDGLAPNQDEAEQRARAAATQHREQRRRKEEYARHTRKFTL